jgi:protein-S-isoprenylcysteine O-methyltransferase Ste14
MFGFLGDLAAAHPAAVVVAFVLAIAWCVSEYLARRSTWRQGAPKRPSTAMDRGTYPFIAIGIVVGLVADLLGFLSGIGSYLPEYAVAIGAVIAVVGLGIRGWALRTLGKFFTMPITIAADHRLVQNGPYRWIRHPAYTGGFLTMVGLAVALGSWLGVVVTLLAGVSVYVYRIRIEEAALRTRFGTEYDEYARRTYRLLPGLY